MNQQRLRAAAAVKQSIEADPVARHPFGASPILWQDDAETS